MRLLISININSPINRTMWRYTNRLIISKTSFQIRQAHVGRDSDIRAIELYYRVTNNLRVSKVLRETANILITKGFTEPTLTPQQQFRLLNDGEIVQSMNKFKRVLDEEKIKFNISDINDFLRFFTSDKYIIEN